jgi:hypothetical protein
MMYGTYEIIQHSVYRFPEKRITLTVVRNIDIIGTAERCVKLGQTL